MYERALVSLTAPLWYERRLVALKVDQEEDCVPEKHLDESSPEMAMEGCQVPAPEILSVFPMLIPLESRVDSWGNEIRPEQQMYTCRNLLPSGDCDIYEHRPKMCRDYPSYNGGRCGYKDCDWRAMKSSLPVKAT